MTPFLVGAITVAAAVVVALGLLSTIARRRIGLLHLVATGVLEALLLLQAALAVAALMGGVRPADTPTFLGYLVGVALAPGAGLLWARTERTRWAGTVLAVAGAVVGVMVWRLLQLWETTGA